MPPILILPLHSPLQNPRNSIHTRLCNRISLEMLQNIRPCFYVCYVHMDSVRALFHMKNPTSSFFMILWKKKVRWWRGEIGNVFALRKMGSRNTGSKSATPWNQFFYSVAQSCLKYLSRITLFEEDDWTLCLVLTDSTNSTEIYAEIHKKNVQHNFQIDSNRCHTTLQDTSIGKMSSFKNYICSSLSTCTGRVPGCLRATILLFYFYFFFET